MTMFFACKVCGRRCPTLKEAERCKRFPTPKRRFRDGDRVSSTVAFRVIPEVPPEDNVFAIRGDGEMWELLVAALESRTHRRQRRVRYLGVTKLKEPPPYLYEDELERIVERKAVAVSA